MKQFFAFSSSAVPGEGRGPFINPTIVDRDHGPRPSPGMTVVILSLLCICFPAFAQKAPVEIEADSQLEWLRAQNMYRGTGNVVIKQGTTIIRGDTAEAHYDAAIGPSALTEMIITGHVSVTDKDNIIRGDRGTYDLRDRKMTMTGHAEVEQPGQILKADTVNAWLSATDNKLQRAEAHGHVMIVRSGKDGKEIAQSEKAIYNAEKKTIDLVGNVKLTRGDNHMTGDHATVDLTTGYSTLKNNPGTGRVRAVFAPGGSAPLPQVTGAMPMIDSKKKLEQPYAVGVKSYEE